MSVANSTEKTASSQSGYNTDEYDQDKRISLLNSLLPDSYGNDKSSKERKSVSMNEFPTKMSSVAVKNTISLSTHKSKDSKEKTTTPATIANSTSSKKSSSQRMRKVTTSKENASHAVKIKTSSNIKNIRSPKILKAISSKEDVLIPSKISSNINRPKIPQIYYDSNQFTDKRDVPKNKASQEKSRNPVNMTEDYEISTKLVNDDVELDCCEYSVINRRGLSKGLTRNKALSGTSILSDVLLNPGDVKNQKNGKLLQEADYDTDLEVQSSESLDPEGTVLYKKICNKASVHPVGCFLRNPKSHVFNLKHRSLGTPGVMALCYPLQTNTYITQLDLSYNGIQDEGVISLCQMLYDNVYITHLNISYNKLSTLAARSICKMLFNNTTIVSLNISGNNFNDLDSSLFREAIIKTKYLQELNISSNKFENFGAADFAAALKVNYSLVKLDFSWNCFGLKYSPLLLTFLSINQTLTWFDISYLGLSGAGAKVLSKGLETNVSLKDLFINVCRLCDEDVPPICKALRKNQTLKELHMRRNNLTVKSLITILQALIKNEQSLISDLDFGEINVDKRYVNVEDNLLMSREISIKRGLVMENYKFRGIYLSDRKIFDMSATELLSSCPLTAWKNFARQRAISEFEHFVKSCIENNVVNINWTEISNQVRLPQYELSQNQYELFIKRLLQTADVNGYVDLTPLLTNVS